MHGPMMRFIDIIILVSINTMEYLNQKTCLYKVCVPVKYLRMELREKSWNLKRNLELVYINNCPTRCDAKQSIHYSAGSLYMFRVSTTPIIRSTQNCNYRLSYFSTLSHKRHDFQKALLDIKFVFWFSLQLLLETFLIKIITEKVTGVNVHRSSCKVTTIRVIF